MISSFGPFRSSYSTAQSHKDWPGVVAVFHPYRIIVSEGDQGGYFRLQFFTGHIEPRNMWAPLPRSSRRFLSLLLRDFSALSGLSDAARHLPDTPEDALPGFFAARSAERDAWAQF